LNLQQIGSDPGTEPYSLSLLKAALARRTPRPVGATAASLEREASWSAERQFRFCSRKRCWRTALQDLSAHQPRPLHAKRRGVRNASSAFAPESGAGAPHSKTCRHPGRIPCTRSVVECGTPVPLSAPKVWLPNGTGNWTLNIAA
jgi:hypothetical protein